MMNSTGDPPTAQDWRTARASRASAAARRRKLPRPTPEDFEAYWRPRLARPGLPRPFNPSGEAGTCLWCGDPLRAHWRVTADDNLQPEGYGEYADNAFCGLRCGYAFGVEMAMRGRRLVVAKDA